MELEIIKLMCYGFGTAIILLFIYITVLAIILLKYIRIESKEDKNF